MRLKDGLILREVAGQYVIVPTGKMVQEVRGINYITKPAACLWEYMQNNEFEKEDLIRLTLERYKDAAREKVSADLDIFLKGLAERGILEIEGQIYGSFSMRMPKVDVSDTIQMAEKQENKSSEAKKK